MLADDSLWGRWIKTNLLKKKSFWQVNENTQVGSWIWRKMLKPRSIAKTFYMKEVGNGHHTSFWYDSWSNKGVMFDLLEERGTIDLGIQREATVEEAFHNHRRRKRHIRALLNDIEKELENTKR